MFIIIIIIIVIVISIMLMSMFVMLDRNGPKKEGKKYVSCIVEAAERIFQ